MAVAVSLVLLLSSCLCGTEAQFDMSTELGLTETVTEQGIAALEARMKEDVAALETRLATSEREVTDLKVQLAKSVAEQEFHKTKVETPEKDKPVGKVAFSAVLDSSITAGPHTTLIFKNIITNIGNGYDNISGEFRAPVKGAFYFTFTGYTRGALAVHLYHNSHKVWTVYGLNKPNHSQSTSSNGAVLELEVADVVFMKLGAGYSLHSNELCYNTFSGFLLFTM